jgi:ribonuclease T2
MRKGCLGLLMGAVMGVGATLPDRAAAFDYYVLAVSWTPGWCTVEGDARDDDRCDAGAGLGWMLHGLWPQYAEGGWPEYCTTNERDATRAQTAAMIDIMGSAGLAWHQWRKHGRCAGMSAARYFETSRAAFEALRLPRDLRAFDRRMQLDPDNLAAAFARAMPGASPESVAVLCRGEVIREVRICLTRTLEPRRCADDVAERACDRDSATLMPVR